VDAALAAGVGRIVFTSTSDVYAVKETAHLETDPLEPYTVYGNTKLFAERILRLAVAANPSLSVGVARLFNVYGSRETNPHVLPDILKQLRRPGTNAIRLGNVWPRRDFVYVEDVADALLTLGRSTEPFDTFNVGSGAAVSIADVVQVVSRLVGRPLAIETDPVQVRAVERACLEANVDKARRELNWKPAWALADGLREWLKADGLLELP
jgi:UDP-glucose 4-epimerase